MAIRLVKGEYVFDTAEEAAEFFRLSSGNGSRMAPALQELNVSNFRSFFGRLHKNQKRLIRAMLGGKDIVTDAELLQDMKLKNNREIGGIMAGISKNAKKSGFQIDALWVSETKYSESGVRSKQFVVSEAFRRVAREAGEIK